MSRSHKFCWEGARTLFSEESGHWDEEKEDEEEEDKEEEEEDKEEEEEEELDVVGFQEIL